MGFVVHWHESAMELHVFPIPIPPPTSFSTWFLWVFPVHQARALVSCIPTGLVICLTIDNILTLNGMTPQGEKTIIKDWKKVKVAQLCPTLCDPMDYTVHEILQARILEWEAFAFSRGSSKPRDWTQVSHIAGGFFTSWAIREFQSNLKTTDNRLVQIG